MLEKTRRWVAAHPNWALTLATLAALAPFLSKPFNVDDPLFIWAAQQIYLHPGNPYGFDVNWAQTVFPMWHVTENPPLACYYVALAAGCFGWSEIGLHSAFLLPAIAVVLGTYRLAEKFCRCPALAALATLFTPVFLVSSMTLMCDVLMLAFWIWAAVLWVEGMERDDFGRLALSGLLVALAELTKYYGVCLMPLLGAYGLFRKHRPGRWMIYLLIPLAVLYGYQVATMTLYGHNLLLDAVQFTSFFAAFEQENHGHPSFATTLTALAFTGGCVSATTLFAPLLWRRRTLMLFGGAAVLLAAFAVFGGALGNSSAESNWTSPLLVKLQIILWMAGGVRRAGAGRVGCFSTAQRRSLAAFSVGRRNIFVHGILQLDGQRPLHSAAGAGGGDSDCPGGWRKIFRQAIQSGREAPSFVWQPARPWRCSFCARILSSPAPPAPARGKPVQNSWSTGEPCGFKATGDSNTTWKPAARGPLTSPILD